MLPMICVLFSTQASAVEVACVVQVGCAGAVALASALVVAVVPGMGVEPPEELREEPHAARKTTRRRSMPAVCKSRCLCAIQSLCFLLCPPCGLYSHNQY